MKNNGAEAPKGSRPMVFKEWRDAMNYFDSNRTNTVIFNHS
jgi:hypothetical protein